MLNDTEMYHINERRRMKKEKKKGQKDAAN